ncbi:MAG: metal-dependent hydrolase [Lachnospiraceae bacterium]|nr:metal-dependent hydrolase [Lachnospiraceae bacterium]
MTYKAHVTGALIFGAGLCYLENRAGMDCNPMVIAVGSIFGGLIPDIDIPRSFVGSRVKSVSKWIHKTFGHRTITHSIWFLAGMSALFDLVDRNLAIAVAVGVLSHIVLDILTPRARGVALFYPVSRKRVYFRSFK